MDHAVYLSGRCDDRTISGGRDHREIERTASIDLVIRDTTEEAWAAYRARVAVSGEELGERMPRTVDTPAAIAGALAPFVDVGFTHFHSSTISGSASWISVRTLASVFPRQSPSSLILASMIAEAESIEPSFLNKLQLSQTILDARRLRCMRGPPVSWNEQVIQRSGREPASHPHPFNNFGN